MAKKAKRALVTGGAGFIGSHLCDALLADGQEVVCLDNLETGRSENLEQARENPLFKLEDRDVCDPFDLEVDAIYHLASPASPVDYYSMPVKTMLANSLGTRNCLELAKKLGVRMVLASTSEVYGDPEVSPQREDYYGHVNPVGLRSCYDEGKRFAEALCKAYEREHETEAVILRIFNTYGSRMRADDGRVMPNFICQALSGEPMTIYGDGSQTRSFCHVSDMVKALALAMKTREAAGEVINAGNPDEMRIIDLAARLREKTGTPSALAFETLPEDDPLQRKPDITKAMKLLGWAPEVSLDQGLDDAIAWFERDRG
jgi:nucleoside-diphosphate-sugar epimerase